MSGSKNTDLPVRLVSAVVLGVAVLTLTWYGGLPFRIMAGLAALLIFNEWRTITSVGDNNAMMMAGWGAVGVGAVAIVAGALSVALGALLVFSAVLGVWAVVNKSGIWIAGGVAYALLPTISLSHIRMESAGLALVLLLFVIVWSTDIGAYFAGRSIGGPKLMPAVSPKKTWSGFFGGVSAAVVGALVLPMLINQPRIAIPVVLMVLLSVLSQLGDLFESWIKRRFGVKDSGHLIPGHGGIMDRTDGLIVAAVAFSMLLYFGLV